MTASQILTFSFMIVFQFHLMVCSSNSIIKDAAIPLKHSTTNYLLSYLYCCTVHFEDSLSITQQQMH